MITLILIGLGPYHWKIVKGQEVNIRLVLVGTGIVIGAQLDGSISGATLADQLSADSLGAPVPVALWHWISLTSKRERPDLAV